MLIRKNKTGKTKGNGAGVILYKIKGESFSDMVTFEQKPEGSEGVSHTVIW